MPSKRNIKLDVSQTEKQWDATFQKMDWWDSERIKSAKVMVVGAGALGNEVLKNLALLNLGHILIVDFDIIEYGNLSRSVLYREADCNKNKAKVAAERVREINPNVKVQYLNGDISIDVGLGVIRRMDVVIGCLDNRVARLFINRHCYKVKKTWVDGAIENLGGQIDVFKPEATCYECQLSPQEWEIIEFRLGCADVAQRNANFGSIPTTPISSSIIGALQVQEALKVIYGHDRDSMVGNGLRFYGKTNDILFSPAAPLKEECDSHVIFEPVIEAPALSCNQSIASVLDWLCAHFNDPTAKILLDEEIILQLGSSNGPKHDIALLKYHISEAVAAKYKSSPEEVLHFDKRTMVLDQNFPYPEKTLKEIGIPPLQILKVEANEDIHFVELTADSDFLKFE